MTMPNATSILDGSVHRTPDSHLASAAVGELRRASGSDTSAIDLLASTLPRLAAGQFPAALAEFHN
jgi:hypothetical protein